MAYIDILNSLLSSILNNTNRKPMNISSNISGFFIVYIFPHCIVTQIISSRVSGWTSVWMLGQEQGSLEVAYCGNTGRVHQQLVAGPCLGAEFQLWCEEDLKR